MLILDESSIGKQLLFGLLFLFLYSVCVYMFFEQVYYPLELQDIAFSVVCISSLFSFVT